MDDRDLILSRLPVSPGGERPTADVELLSAPKDRLWETFCERLLALRGEIVAIEGLSEFSGRCFCDQDVPGYVQDRLGEPVHSVWEAEVGVTVCELAVAETGSVLIGARAGRWRLASLAPQVHVALVWPDTVVASLEEAVRLAPSGTCHLVSGPSRTADIEGVMVMGIHGPKRLLVVPLPR